MRHLNDGVLRRMLDEPFSVSPLNRQHYANCRECRDKVEEIKGNVDLVTSFFGADEVRPDTVRALNGTHGRIRSENMTPASAWRTWLSRRAPFGYRRQSKSLTAAGLVTVLVASLALTPAGSFAQSFITIFQAKHVTAVAITAADLQSLPNLNKYGTTHLSARLKSVKVRNLSTAQRIAQYKVLAPQTLPSGTPTSVKYTVLPGGSGTFTFSAAKARESDRGQRIPPMPSHLNGSTLKVKIGTAVIALYGSASAGLPALAVGQMRAPSVSSTGVSVKEIENYVLGLPGVSPRLAAALRSISDPTSTLPIPIPVDKASSQSVTVQGVPGLAIGDSTGIGSVVIWQKNGTIYGVGGTQTQTAILAVANSLS